MILVRVFFYVWVFNGLGLRVRFACCVFFYGVHYLARTWVYGIYHTNMFWGFSQSCQLSCFDATIGRSIFRLLVTCWRSCLVSVFSFAVAKLSFCQIQEMVKYLNGVVELLEAHFLGSWTLSTHQGSKRESSSLTFPRDEFYMK